MSQTEGKMTREEIENVLGHYAGEPASKFAEGLEVQDVRRLCDLSLSALAHDASREGFVRAQLGKDGVWLHVKDGKGGGWSINLDATNTLSSHAKRCADHYRALASRADSAAEQNPPTATREQRLGSVADGECSAQSGPQAVPSTGDAKAGSIPAGGAEHEPAAPQEKPWTAGPAFSTGAERELSAATSDVKGMHQTLRDIFKEYGVGDGSLGWIEHTDQDGKLRRDSLSFEGELIFNIEALLTRLSPAHARGPREGLEEAAKVCEAAIDELYITDVVLNDDYFKGFKAAIEARARAIRAKIKPAKEGASDD